MWMSGKTKGLLTASVMMVLTGSSVSGAEITVKRWNNGPGQIISLEGDIREGDEKRFTQAVAAIPNKRGLVRLNSAGGQMLPGLVIAEKIRDKQFQTLVDAGDRCWSICGIIWISGVTRHAAPTARIGFHGVYNIETSQASSAGNALLGAFLKSKLGLSYSAISYITSKAHDEITVLTFEDAKRYGFEAKPWKVTAPKTATKSLNPNDQAYNVPGTNMLNGQWLLQACLRAESTAPSEALMAGYCIGALAFYTPTCKIERSPSVKELVKEFVVWGSSNQDYINNHGAWQSLDKAFLEIHNCAPIATFSKRNKDRFPQSK